MLLLLLLSFLHLELQTGNLFVGAHFHWIGSVLELQGPSCGMWDRVVSTKHVQKSQVGGCSALSDTLCNSGMDPRAIFLNVIFFSGEEVNAFYLIMNGELTGVQRVLSRSCACSWATHVQRPSSGRLHALPLENCNSELLTCSICVQKTLKQDKLRQTPDFLWKTVGLLFRKLFFIIKKKILVAGLLHQADTPPLPLAGSLGPLQAGNLYPGLRDIFDCLLPSSTIHLELQMLNWFHWAFLFSANLRGLG